MLLILNKCITQQCLHINKQVGLKTVAGALPGAGEVRVQSSRTTCGKGASVRILFRGRAILFPRIHNTLFSCKWNQPLLIWHVCPPLHAFYFFFLTWFLLPSQAVFLTAQLISNVLHFSRPTGEPSSVQPFPLCQLTVTPSSQTSWTGLFTPAIVHKGLATSGNLRKWL